MVNINIFGDFCVRHLDGLTFSDRLQSILDLGDINVLNFEAPIYVSNEQAIPKSGPSLSQDPDAPCFLAKHNFNLFTLANNHIMDFGKNAALKTIKAFDDFVTLGCGEWKEAYQYKIIKVKGKSIGFLALTQYEFGVLGEKQFDDFGTAWLCHPCVDELIIEAKLYCDCLILFPHAGLEHFDYPLPELCTLYRHFIIIGVDAVIGNHPHVPQPWEYYNDSPIIYSLGNFVFDSLKPQNKWWYYGLMAQLNIDQDNRITVDVSSVAFDKNKRVVDCCDDNKLSRHLDDINEIFADTNRYIQEVNKHCLSLEFLYDYQFECSGYIRPNIRKYSKAICNRLKEKIFKSNVCQYNPTHYINNLRCEPHRWVISRIFELKYNAK